MTSMLKLSRHAIVRFGTRTGIPVYKAASELRKQIETAKLISVFEACNYFSMTRVEKNCSYLMWENETIKELMLAIVKNRTVITVLTQNMFGPAPRSTQTSRYVLDNGNLVKMDGWLVNESVQLGQVCFKLK